MTTKLSEKDQKTLDTIRQRANEMLKACDEFEIGKIDQEELEHRVTKFMGQFAPYSAGYFK